MPFSRDSVSVRNLKPAHASTMPTSQAAKNSKLVSMSYALYERALFYVSGKFGVLEFWTGKKKFGEPIRRLLARGRYVWAVKIIDPNAAFRLEATQRKLTLPAYVQCLYSSSRCEFDD